KAPAPGPHCRPRYTNGAHLWQRIGLRRCQAKSALPGSLPARLTPAMLARADASVASLGQQVSPARITRTGIAVAYLDRLSCCREPLQRAIQHGREGGAITSAIEALFLLGQDAFHTGRWDEAT